MTTSVPVVLTALRIESLAVRSGMGRGPRVLVSGMGRAKSLHTKRNLAGPVLVAGFCGALTDRLHPGDLVVANEVRGAGDRIPLPGAEKLAALLRESGWPVHVGAVLTVSRVVDGAQRAALADDGALAVDMESAYLVAGVANATVIRAVVDTPSRPLRSVRSVAGGVAAIRALRAVGPAILEWSCNQQKEVYP
jgi:4-hydroxy-3-methylbut-2-enyl diphosphate reductase